MKKALRQKFSVPFTYEVNFTEAVFDTNNSLFFELVKTGKKTKVFFVIDQGVVRTHPTLLSDIKNYIETYKDSLTLCASPLVVPGGEVAKNNQQYFQQVLDATSDFGIDRHSFIVAIGGGAVLDMVGYAAAIAHRGIRHIRIPTTVLAQNDSGVGVKNGINAYNKKNYLGTFAPPFAVINDFTFLNTLDDKDWRSGISEAIKVALIKDVNFFSWIEANAQALKARSMAPMQELIYRCAEMHLEHIAGGDPFESGSSRPLDFGHWAAHKLEQLTDFQLRHGEAVAIGIALDSTYSHLKGYIAQNDLQRILNLFKALEFDVYIPELSEQKVFQGLDEFREHLGGELTITLLEDIGKGIEVHEMDKALLLTAINKLKAYNTVTSII